tara:strand:- start:4406 stop:5026 length:621 start_codon:yes stop_codon:yes gene_type:complete
MNNYNYIAFCYTNLVKAIFGNSLKKAQEIHIKNLPETGNVLFIGGGNGTVLKLINQLKPNLKIDYIDQSKKMISLSRVLAGTDSTNFIIGNEHAIPNKNYDAIITFFFLDLFQKDKRISIISLLKSKLKNEGIWLVADFNAPTNWKQQLTEKMMFWFLKVTTKIESDRIENYRDNLSHIELNETHATTFNNGFVFSSVFIKVGVKP